MDDLDAAVALVYAQPPSGFVAARSALVKELKAAKRKDDAAMVAALRRPTKLAWAVGEAVRSTPEAAEEFFSAVEALAEPGADLRRCTADLRAAVTALVVAADGVDPGDANAALLAVAADPDATDALRRGRLAHVPAAGGFGALGFGLPPAPAPPKETKKGKERKAPDGEATEEAREVAGDEAAQARAEEDRQEQEARARAEELAALQAAHAEAVAAEEAAAERLQAAQAAVDEAQAELDRAAKRHDEAREAAAAAADALQVAEEPG